MSLSTYDVIASASDDHLASALMTSYSELEEAMLLCHWKSAGVAAGHFVEATRRFVELKLFGSYTAIGKNLSGFGVQVLSMYEAGNGHESYRFHIPRAMFAVYGFRNKKGYGHLSLDVANRVDVGFMAQNCRWALAEIVRINSDFSITETDEMVSKVCERSSPIIWDIGGVMRILEKEVSLKDSVLVLLYHKQMRFSELSASTEAKTPYLKKTLRNLHATRLIEFDESKMECSISPTGILRVEVLLGSVSEINAKQS